jgi:hypothetical protein
LPRKLRAFSNTSVSDPKIKRVMTVCVVTYSRDGSLANTDIVVGEPTRGLS